MGGHNIGPPPPHSLQQGGTKQAAQPLLPNPTCPQEPRPGPSRALGRPRHWLWKSELLRGDKATSNTPVGCNSNQVTS